MKKLAASLVCVALVMGGCSGGQIIGSVTMVTATLGAAGGSIGLPGGGGQLVIPAGALGSMTEISIERVDASTIDASVPPGQAEGYVFEPAGMMLAMPATLELVSSPETVEGAGTKTGLSTVWLALFGEAGRTYDSGARTDENGNTVQTVTFNSLSSLWSTPMGVLQVRGPARIPVGVPTTITAELTIRSEFTIVTSAGVQWGRSPTVNLSSSLPEVQRLPSAFDQSSIPYSGGDPLDGTTGGTFVDTFTVTCPSGATSGSVDVLLDVSITNAVRNWSIKGTPTSSQLLNPSGIWIELRTPFSVECEPSTAPPAIQEGLIDVGNVITAIEGITRMPTGAPCKSAGGFDVLLAGGDAQTATPKAISIDPTTGSVVEIFQFSGGPNIANAFDAHLIMPPSGSTSLDPTILATGFGSSSFSIGSGCVPAAFGQVGFGFFQDSTYATADPRDGVVTATASGIDHRVLSKMVGGLQLTQIPVGGIRTVVANGMSSYLVVTDARQLMHVSWNGSNATTTPIAGVTLGSNPRRMRWDPNSGLLGLTDFTDNTMHLFMWDGMLSVQSVGVANVVDGPVGLDVMNDKAVCVGFRDGGYSIIDVDPLTMTIETTSNQPNPYPMAGSPGHGIFFGDSENSIGISYFGTSQFGIRKNAF